MRIQASSLMDQTWKSLFGRLEPLRLQQLHPIFNKGCGLLEIDRDRVPDLERVNRRLSALTGFRGRYVSGHEPPVSFFPMLAQGEFPIGNFIRDASDLDYTPAPDVFHDLYGHLPFLTDPGYADFSRRFGKVASQYQNDPACLIQFERLYWFTLEFGLIKTPDGMRIFGGGIASSYKECAYSLSSAPSLVPFDLEAIRRQDFRIDRLQEKLFVIESEAQLYRCLDEFDHGVKPYADKIQNRQAV